MTVYTITGSEFPSVYLLVNKSAVYRVFLLAASRN